MIPVRFFPRSFLFRRLWLSKRSSSFTISFLIPLGKQLASGLLKIIKVRIIIFASVLKLTVYSGYYTRVWIFLLTITLDLMFNITN